MSTLTLSANVNGNIPNVSYNDLYLDESGNISVSTDQEALIEQCAQASKTLLGELIYNTTIGIPYQQAVWIGVPNVAQFNAALRQAFLSIPNVIEVVSLIVSQGGNLPGSTISFSAIIRTNYGVGNVIG